MPVDYYKTLEISKDASVEEIRKNYKRLSMLHHPDKHSSSDEKTKKAAEEKFKEVSEAYQILSEPEKRNQYDHGTLTKQNITMKVEVSVLVSDLLNGKEMTKTIQRPVHCETCDGFGTKDKNPHICKNCNGQRFVVQAIQLAPGFVQQVQQPCGFCRGTGREINRPICMTCQGQGKILKPEDVTFYLPAGLPQGFPQNQKVVVKDEIAFIINVEDPNYTLILPVVDNCCHVQYNTTINLVQMCGGVHVPIKFLDGSIVNISGNVLHPDIIRAFEGQGLSLENSPLRGHLLVKFNLKLPDSLTVDQQNKMRWIFPNDIPKEKVATTPWESLPIVRGHEKPRPNQPQGGGNIFENIQCANQ
jgi:DnaJ-class molecular chaperone